jgi:hypothetical protein
MTQRPILRASHAMRQQVDVMEPRWVCILCSFFLYQRHHATHNFHSRKKTRGTASFAVTKTSMTSTEIYSELCRHLQLKSPSHDAIAEKSRCTWHHLHSVSRMMRTRK